MKTGAKMKKEEVWSYRLTEPRDIVLNYLHEGQRLIAAEVTSGDSGKTYWVYLLYFKPPKHKGQVIGWCDCSDSKHVRLPRLLSGLVANPPVVAEGDMCKHAMYLAETLVKSESA